MEFKKKIASLVALVGIFMLSGIIIFQLQVAFGWSNPTLDPPDGNGAIGAQGSQVFVNTVAPSSTTTLTVNGAVSVMGNLISDVLTPIGGRDAANKNYVDAQVADAGGGTITMFNVAKNSLIPGVQGGEGVPNCPSGYTQVVAGFGPHAFLSGYGWNGPGGLEFELPDDPSITKTSGIVAGSFSICSNSRYEIWPNQLPLNSGQYPAYSRADACALYSIAEETCNTCRICVKGSTIIEGFGAVPGDTR